jgi:succinate-semialdehyde dehydrogenase/glutarate-semialdehyde dehydrogenase
MTDASFGGALAIGRADFLAGAALIGGEWVDGEQSIPVVNPATGGILGHVASLGPSHAGAAVTAAATALPAWRARTAQERGRILRAWFDAINDHQRDLSRILTAEQGKPMREAEGEIAYAASYVEWFAEEARRAYGEIIPGHAANKRLLVARQPVGVVAAITPWNFPAAMVTRKLAPALAAGCTVILKPSEFTPFTALALARLAREAGVPDGVINVVTGPPEAIGAVLTSDPRVRKLSFTGSTRVGKLLAARCMETVKRLSLELGGNAPFIVFDDADLDKAVEGAVASKFRNSGQTCVCANRLLVQSGVYEAFAERLAARAGALTLGNGLAGACDQGPLINEQALAKVERHVEDARARGARLLTGGTRAEGPGHFFQPTVLTEVSPDALLCREETFGPVAGLVRFHTEREAVTLANNSAAGLAAYLFTRDASRIWRVNEALDYGMVGINTGVLSTELAPFGGIKESGFGREGSRHGLDEYLDMKFLCIDVEPLAA